MILAVILACEIAFWVAVVLGLAVRYVARRPRLGLVILASVPVIDIVLLAAVALNLRSGASATLSHAVAAFYLGFSLAYGHRLVAWADRWFAYRFRGAPRPVRRTGAEHTRACWGDVGRTAFACLLTVAISAGFIDWIDDASRTAAMATNYRWAGFIFGIELLAALSYTLWPRQAKGDEAPLASSR